ncbi:unnamed protein product [Heligmosomoides polygyrus]|uniref:ULP_PROTEASE domain-containing protein n=1 Tax=Heligmosomoides polygyrus TaxID=6339 RepID=A0A3P7Y0D3_HELPZ|nr:unnamed protein product [Heligmosomoides polygyrus]
MLNTLGSDDGMATGGWIFQECLRRSTAESNLAMERFLLPLYRKFPMSNELNVVHQESRKLNERHWGQRLSIRNARRNFANFKTKMTALRRPDGIVTSSRRAMKKLVHDFYSDLIDSQQPPAPMSSSARWMRHPLWSSFRNPRHHLVDCPCDTTDPKLSIPQLKKPTTVTKEPLPKCDDGGFSNISPDLFTNDEPSLNSFPITLFDDLVYESKGLQLNCTLAVITVNEISDLIYAHPGRYPDEDRPGVIKLGRPKEMIYTYQQLLLCVVIHYTCPESVHPLLDIDDTSSAPGLLSNDVSDMSSEPGPLSNHVRDTSSHALDTMWFYIVPVTVFLKMSNHLTAILELHRQGKHERDIINQLGQLPPQKLVDLRSLDIKLIV